MDIRSSLLPTFCSPHRTISPLTKQSRTCGSSYISICRRPRRSMCSMVAMSRGEIAAACVLKLYRTSKRNLGCDEGILVSTMRNALQHGETPYGQLAADACASEMTVRTFGRGQGLPSEVLSGGETSLLSSETARGYRQRSTRYGSRSEVSWPPFGRSRRTVTPTSPESATRHM